MEPISQVTPSLQKLNTKGCCFLCLQSNIIKTEDFENNQLIKSTSIRSLLRHLQIPTVQSLDEKSKFENNLKQDIKVDLCKNCGHMMDRFSVLFQKLEKIQLEMDYFLEKISKCVSQSAKDTELVQNYSKKMTSDLEALSQLAFVDNLRKQVAKEGLKKMNVPRLQLILNRADIQLIKTEINEEFESNGVDFAENLFLDDISQSLSPNSTANQEENIKMLTINTSLSVATLGEEEKPAPSLQKSVIQKSKYFTKDVHTGMYKCNNCDKKSKNAQTVRVHFKSVHLKLRYKCDICNTSAFKKSSYLTLHKKTCQEKLEKKLRKEKDPKFKFICKICGKRFEKYKKLKDHTRFVHKNANRFQCDLCDKKYTTMSMLKNHQEAIHQSVKFRCKICNKMYKYMQNLKLHEKRCVNETKIKLESVE